MFDIEEVICSLKKEKKVFYSEAHFQLELAWVIKSLYENDYKIYLEYTPPDMDLRDENDKKKKKKIHIDIWLKNKKNDKIIPIELKYKTKACKLVDQDGETFELTNHAAKDIGCYLYLKDIQRIELIKSIKKSEFEKGYAIMLTNDLSYTKQPRKRDFVYSAFSIDQGNVKTGILQWGDAASDGTKKGIEDAIRLDGKYLMNWREYSEFPMEGEIFKYLVSQI